MDSKSRGNNGNNSDASPRGNNNNYSSASADTVNQVAALSRRMILMVEKMQQDVNFLKNDFEPKEPEVKYEYVEPQVEGIKKQSKEQTKLMNKQAQEVQRTRAD